MKPDLTYLSLGAGVQSTALWLCSMAGLHNVPYCDVAIFADTGHEPAWIYDHVEWMKSLSPIPIHTVSNGAISGDLKARLEGSPKSWKSIPAFSNSGDQMLRRQCTSEYKITPIYREVRKLLGLKPYQRFKGTVLNLQGISYDEILRMKSSRVNWIENVYPLIDAGLDRQDCIDLLKEWDFPVPGKSACVFCPYHSDAYWKDLKEHAPEEFQNAVDMEHQLQNMDKIGLNKAFLHKSCIPLDQVEFADRGEGFISECDGYCGV